MISNEGKLTGIVTSWDIARAVANKIGSLEKIISVPVVTTAIDEPIDEVILELEQYSSIRASGHRRRRKRARSHHQRMISPLIQEMPMKGTCQGAAMSS